MTSLDARTLPHSLAAERAVLGAILIDNEAFAVAGSVVTGASFFRDAHRRIFEALVALETRHVPMELVTLHEELARTRQLDECGGPAYVAALIDGVPRATNVEYYARIVAEKATLRRLITEATRMIAGAYEAEEPADVVVEQAERAVLSIRREGTRGEFVLADTWFTETLTQIQHAYETRRLVTGLPTGLPTLDRMTRGLQPSDLVFIAARTSIGKTALALQLALETSKHAMTGFVSCEMSRRAVGMRAVAVEARVDAFKLMTGHLTDHELGRVAAAVDALAQRRLAIDDSSSQTASAIRSKVRRLAQRYGLGACFVDYIQLLREPGRREENRTQELASISAGLKDLARDLNVPIVVLSQVNRSSEKENRRPRLSDIRDSGALEQDADLVLILHRPGQHDDGQKYGEGEVAELIVGKQRNGPTGVIKLAWLGEQMRFAELHTDVTHQSAFAGGR